jgi:hypothetical protein
VRSKYKSGKSVAKNPTVTISADDPRAAWNKISQTKSRQGAEVDILGFNGKSLASGGTGLSNPNGTTSSPEPESAAPKIFVPPTNGNAAYVISQAYLSPTAVSDVVASWSGEDLVVTFDWEYDNADNQSASEFIVELTVGTTVVQTPLKSFLVNKTQTAQTLTVTKAMNQGMFGVPQTSLTSICVLVTDAFYNVSTKVCASSVPEYILDLPVPEITVTSITNGYSVAYTVPTESSFNSIEVVEYESTSSTEPTGVTYSRTYFGAISPANVIVHNYNARWIKARFYSDSGATTDFSTAYKVTPTSAVSVDLTPPDEVTTVTGVWSGENIIVSYNLPSSNAGARIQIRLTASNNSVGYFYAFPSGAGTSQTHTITKSELFSQFGTHYSSYTGLLKSIDANDNRSSGVSFSVATRANPLLGITPTFSLVPLSNGYSVNFTLPIGAQFAEVYAKHTAWSGDPTDDTYVVGAGLPPLVIIDTDYTTAYIKVRYYDDFDNTSNYSAEGTVTPLNPGEITSFENPITFGENAVIYAGNSATTGTRTLFKTGGIFAYDATNTSPSTQIVSNAAEGTPTFITTQAQIADWQIKDTKIENTLAGAPTAYTGLSATGPYSFWAGSEVSGGNSSANFTVTPGGAVTARNITIIGNGNTSSNLISAGGLFTVKNDGTFSATGASISGTIYAQGGQFNGNVLLNGGSLYAPGAGGSANSGIRTVFNASGIAAFNGDGGYAEMLTTPLANGAVFSTNAADIGGWEITTGKIQKTSITGKGNIILDSDSGYIAVSNSSISTYLAGINSPSSDPSSSVFWAGNGTGPNDTSNPFRVTLAGKLYSSSGQIGGATDYWTIDSNGITANNGAQIKIGNYEIKASDTSEFAIFYRNPSTQATSSILLTNTIAGYDRIYLGQEGRQVEVAKNAEISGSYSGSDQDYRSGGLRNMYTITTAQFANNLTAFPGAGTGSVLLVYTP